MTAFIGIDKVYIILRDDLDTEAIHKLSLEEIVQDVAGEESSSAISVKLSDAYIAETEMLDDEELGERFAKTIFARTFLKNADENQRRIARKLYRRAVYQLIDLYKQQKLVAFYQLDMNLKKFCVFFERSNSKGIQLNFTDILAAKLYHGFNLRNKIDEFETESKFKLNREIIVRAIAYIVSIERKGPIYIDRSTILEHLEAEDFQRHWDSTCKLYVESLQYLVNQCYILSKTWMPSENAIIPLMIFLKKIKSFDNMNEEQRKFIEYWYWASVFSNRYSGSSNEAIIADSEALNQIAHGERITARNYFIRLRSLITEPDDLFSYTKKSTALYRGILNLLGYSAQGLRDWKNTQKIDVTMPLEDHHIYPRAYITNGPQMADIDRNEAEQMVDCVVNRTLIPKTLNIQISKRPPTDYLAEIQQRINKNLAECLPSHLIPVDMITDPTWNLNFKFFLTERAQRIFGLIAKYTIDQVGEMSAHHGIQPENNEGLQVLRKPRLKDMLADGRVLVGDRVFTYKNPNRFATIVDGETVDFEGELLPINTWGQQMTGWVTISIYGAVFLERTGKPLNHLREQE